MKLKLSLLIAGISLVAFMTITTPTLVEACTPQATECGPLMGNASGTSFCCNNTDESCCYAAACGDDNSLDE